MDINTISYNVRGLNSRRFRIRLKKFICEVKCNVTFIQEHKLRVVNDLLLATQIWKGGWFYITVAIDGVHTDRNPVVQVGKGGIAIGVSHKIATNVSHSITSPCGRAILLFINDPLGTPYGLLNIYVRLSFFYRKNSPMGVHHRIY